MSGAPAARPSKTVTLSAKAGALLEPFNGRWSLDLKRSDPVTPMLEALKTPYLLRKLAASLNVEQTIRVNGNDFEIQNDTAYGSTTAVHLVNGGSIELKDARGETTLDETIVDEEGPYPIIIRAVLPQNKGFTKDSRRVNRDEMEQVLEYRREPEGTPIVMKRYWNRLDLSPGTVSKKIESESDTVAASSRRTQSSSIPSSSSAPSPAAPIASNAVPVAQKSQIQSVDRPVEAPEPDWPTFIVVVIFATSAWFRSNYLEGLLWIGLAALLRTTVIFPSNVQGASLWWGIHSARFSATALAMLFGTRVILTSEERDTSAYALEAFVAVGAYLWTRRADLAQLEISNIFSRGSVTTQHAWAELAILGIAIVAILSSSEEYGFAEIILAVGLYVAARYRIVAAVSRLSQKPRGVGNGVRQRPSPRVVTKKLVPPTLTSVQVTQSRVVKYTKKPFAQYLVEVDSTHGRYAVWCRYRDLRACRDAILLEYVAKGWGTPPAFPGKQWDSTSDSVIAKRQVELDAFFSNVFADHGKEVAAIPIVKLVLRLDEPRAQQLRYVYEATQRLFTAKQQLDTAVREGEDSQHGWLLTDYTHREYCKVSPVDGRCVYKRVGVLLGTPEQALNAVLSERPVWDRTFTSEEILHTLEVSPDDWDRVFSGTTPVPGHEGVQIKRIVRRAASILAVRPHDLVVYQVILQEKVTGALLFLESAVGDVTERNFAEETNGYQRVRPLVNGFMFEPFAKNRTKVTSIRDEDYAAAGFAIPSF